MHDTEVGIRPDEFGSADIRTSEVDIGLINNNEASERGEVQQILNDGKRYEGASRIARGAEKDDFDGLIACDGGFNLNEDGVSYQNGGARIYLPRQPGPGNCYYRGAAAL